MKYFVIITLLCCGLKTSTINGIKIPVGDDQKKSVDALTDDVAAEPVKPVEVETPKVPSQAAPKPENITVNATVEKVEKESEVVQTNVDNDTNVVKNETAKASVEEKVETVKKQVDNVHVATTEEPPVVEELDSFEKIKVAVADFNRAMWGGDDDDEEDEEEDDKDDNDDDEDDDDDDEDEDDNKHFWEWR